ncbi:MAG: hypothetical protein IJW46_02885, partial [Clostridia bacterium]|nr:hypothetical protein [Clostridia bacterium]
PIASQTVVMDLDEVKALYGIHITLGEGAVLPDYRLMGSLDGENYTILVDTTLRDAVTFAQGTRTTVSEALSGNYRYLKLLWLNAPSNSTVKTIAEIELFAEGKTPTAPKAPDVSALAALYHDLRKLNNSEKRYSAASFGKLSEALFAAGVLLGDPAYADARALTSAKDAIEQAYRALVERLGDPEEEMTAYISARENAASHDLRFVVSAEYLRLKPLQTLTLTAQFTTASGTKTATYTLDPNGTREFGLFRTATGGGKTYEAIGGHVLFGFVIKDIPQNGWTSLTLTVTSGDTVLLEAACTYDSLMA